MLLGTHDTTLLSLLVTTLPTGDEDCGLGSGLTIISPGIGLWQDLGGFYALHGLFGFDITVGSTSGENLYTTIVYVTAITKTVIPKDTSFSGNITFFVEFNGSSEYRNKRLVMNSSSCPE